MSHEERVKLIADGVDNPVGIWADLGCGKGAFTLALAELLHAPAEIYAVDNKRKALKELKSTFEMRFPNIMAHFLEGDLVQELDLPALDGILMANALHYIEEKQSFMERIHSHLKTTGCLLLIEYNVKRRNPWVPYPISFEEWKSLAERIGFKDTRLLGTRPSKYQHEFYAAVSRV